MADCRFEKKFRLLSASDFSDLKVDSLSFKKPSVIIYFKKNSFNLTRIGISVPKRLGKAHDRNRLKRLIREFYRQSPYRFLGFDILFVVSWNHSLSLKSTEEKEATLLKNMEDFFVHVTKINEKEKQ